MDNVTTVGGGVSVGRAVVGDEVAVGVDDGVDVTGVRAAAEVLEICTVLTDEEVWHAENSHSDKNRIKVKIWL